MKSIIRLAIAVVACSAGAAWSQSATDAPSAIQGGDEQLTVAQVYPQGEGGSVRREAPAGAKLHKRSLHEEMGLSADGSFPSRGGPVDD